MRLLRLLRRMLSCVVCPSVTLVHAAKAARRNAMPFGRDIRLIVTVTISYIIFQFLLYGHWISTDTEYKIVSKLRHSVLEVEWATFCGNVFSESIEWRWPKLTRPLSPKTETICSRADCLCLHGGAENIGAWRSTFLLPAFHVRRRHREHTTRVPRLSRHHTAHSPASVRALVRQNNHSPLQGQLTDWLADCTAQLLTRQQLQRRCGSKKSTRHKVANFRRNSNREDCGCSQSQFCRWIPQNGVFSPVLCIFWTKIIRQENFPTDRNLGWAITPPSYPIPSSMTPLPHAARSTAITISQSVISRNNYTCTKWLESTVCPHCTALLHLSLLLYEIHCIGALIPLSPCSSKFPPLFPVPRFHFLNPRFPLSLLRNPPIDPAR